MQIQESSPCRFVDLWSALAFQNCRFQIHVYCRLGSRGSWVLRTWRSLKQKMDSFFSESQIIKSCHGNSSQKVEEELPFYDRCLPSPAFSTVALVMTLARWSFSTNKRAGALAKMEDRRTCEFLLNVVLSNVIFDGCFTFPLLFDSSWTCTWPRPPSSGKKHLERPAWVFRRSILQGPPLAVSRHGTCKCHFCRGGPCSLLCSSNWLVHKEAIIKVCANGVVDHAPIDQLAAQGCGLAHKFMALATAYMKAESRESFGLLDVFKFCTGHDMVSSIVAQVSWHASMACDLHLAAQTRNPDSPNAGPIKFEWDDGVDVIWGLACAIRQHSLSY